MFPEKFLRWQETGFFTSMALIKNLLFLMCQQNSSRILWLIKLDPFPSSGQIGFDQFGAVLAGPLGSSFIHPVSFNSSCTSLGKGVF